VFLLDFFCVLLLERVWGELGVFFLFFVLVSGAVVLCEGDG